MLALFRDGALGSKLVALSVKHSDNNLVCSVVANESGNCNLEISIVLLVHCNRINHRSRNGRPICSCRLFGSAAAEHCNFNLIEVVIIGNASEIVGACLGYLESRHIGGVLNILALGLCDKSAVCTKQTHLTVVVTALYPPDLDGSRALGGELNYVLGGFANLRLSAEVQALCAYVRVLEGLRAWVNLCISAVIYVKKVFGSCRLNVAVSLRSLRHCSKVECGVESIGNLSEDRNDNLYLIDIVVLGNASEIVGACLGYLERRHIGRVLHILALGLCDKSAVCTKQTHLTVVVTALYPPDLDGSRALGGELNYVFGGFANLRLATEVQALCACVSIVEGLRA